MCRDRSDEDERLFWALDEYIWSKTAIYTGWLIIHEKALNIHVAGRVVKMIYFWIGNKIFETNIRYPVSNNYSENFLSSATDSSNTSWFLSRILYYICSIVFVNKTNQLLKWTVSEWNKTIMGDCFSGKAFFPQHKYILLTSCLGP